VGIRLSRIRRRGVNAEDVYFAEGRAFAIGDPGAIRSRKHVLGLEISQPQRPTRQQHLDLETGSGTSWRLLLDYGYQLTASNYPWIAPEQVTRCTKFHYMTIEWYQDVQ
jgi:hypothetical protein